MPLSTIKVVPVSARVKKKHKHIGDRLFCMHFTALKLTETAA